MIRTILYLIIVCLGVSQTQAQSFYFPRENYRDSAAIAAGIPFLAKQLLQAQQPNKEDSLYSLIFVKLALKEYTASNNVIDTLRALYAQNDTLGVKGFALDYEVYSQSQLLHQNSSVSFDNLFDSLYKDKFAKLNPSEKREASLVLYTSTEEWRSNLNETIGQSGNGDSLSYNTATRLVRTFVAWQVMKSVEFMLDNFYTLIDQRDYNFKNILITLKDGSQAEAIIATKDASQKLPAVLCFNIYINNTWTREDVKRMADKGFVGITVFTRGKGKSPQEIEPYEHDASDVYDIIDWISKQPYCNGKVGMYGGSYLGFTQWAAAKTMHPALRSIMPQAAVAPCIDYPYFHGILMTEPLRWIHYTTNTKQTDYDNRKDTMHWWHVLRQWYASGAAVKKLDSMEGHVNPIYQRWLQHPYHDDFWKKMTCYDADFDKVNIPVLTTTGYFDEEQTGAMYYFNEHYKHMKNANHYLVIGPYDHHGAQETQPDVLLRYKIDSVAYVSFTDLAIKWFNYTLKDSAKPALLKDKVNFEIMGANEWRHGSSLQAMSNDTLTFYLSNKLKNNSYQLLGKPDPKHYLQQTINLTDHSDTTKQNRMFGEPLRIIDSVLQTKNSLVFATLPFETSFIVNNSFFGEIRAAINKKDMDVTIYMWEQMTDGTYFSLGSFIQRASLAKNKSKRQLLTPNVKETIPVNWSYITAKKINKGSRLVITLGINNTYETEVNYGSGKPVRDETNADAGEPLQIKWFADSFIKIPVWR